MLSVLWPVELIYGPAETLQSIVSVPISAFAMVPAQGFPRSTRRISLFILALAVLMCSDCASYATRHFRPGAEAAAPSAEESKYWKHFDARNYDGYHFRFYT